MRIIIVALLVAMMVGDAVAVDREATPTTLASTLAEAKPGDRVLLRGGNYVLKRALVPAGALVTILPYPGEAVTVQPVGSSPIPFTWPVDLMADGGYEDALALPVLPLPTPSSSDTVVPTITWTTPNNASFISNDVTVRVAARDNVAVTRVELFRAGNPNPIVVAGETQLPNQTTFLRWQAASIPRASYLLTVYAYDAAGNKSLPATITVIRK